MTFATPMYLLLGVVVLLCAIGGGISLRKRRELLNRILSAEQQQQLLPPRLSRIRVYQVLCSVLALFLLTLAAAGPRLGFQWRVQEQEGVTIMTVLDISNSMDAQDQSPSRLEFAKRKLLDFSSLLRGDAVGLVVFAGGAYLKIPPTVDYGAYQWSLQDSSTGLLQAQGSRMAGAVEVATAALGRAEGAGKAMLLVSDGEGHDEEEAWKKASEQVVAAGVTVFALLVGTEAGAPIPLSDGGFRKDKQGNVVVSRSQPDRMRALAAATGGAFVEAVASDEDVRMLYEQEIRGKLQSSSRGVRETRDWNERFQWPLMGAVLLLGLGSFMGIGRVPGRKKLIPASQVIPLLLLLGAGAAWAGNAEDGITAWKNGNYPQAVEALGQARVEDPSNREVARALAESLYRTGQYREAESLFESLAQTASGKEQAVYTYNAGNAAYKGGRLDDALAYFDEAMKQDPEFAAAQKNSKLVQQEIALRTRPPEEKPQPQEGQPQEGQPQEGQPQEGQPQEGQPQEGQPQDPSQQDPSQKPGSQKNDAGEPETQEPSTQEPSTQEPSTEEPIEALDDEGEPTRMSPEEAARLVDSVTPGKPRVAVEGKSDGRDW